MAGNLKKTEEEALARKKEEEEAAARLHTTQAADPLSLTLSPSSGNQMKQGLSRPLKPLHPLVSTLQARTQPKITQSSLAQAGQIITSNLTNINSGWTVVAGDSMPAPPQETPTSTTTATTQTVNSSV